MTAKVLVFVQRPVTVVRSTTRSLAPVPCCDNDEITVENTRTIKVPVYIREPFEIDVPGIQGPPGPQGPAGEGTPAYVVTAAYAISAHRVVAVADDLAYYPDLTNPQDVENIIGISSNSAAAGDDVTIQALGEFVEPLWIWTPGTIYCALADGMLTQTPPDTGAVFEVARALTPTRVAVGLKTPTLRG